MIRKQVHLTQEELEARLAYWKGVLHLNDWDVKVKIYRAYDMPKDVQGRCEWVLSRREAQIRILDPVDWDESIIFPQDMETTLVHELLHLYGASLKQAKEGSPCDIALEQMIHHVAYALTGVQRGDA